jgi:hypothetical protein
MTPVNPSSVTFKLDWRNVQNGASAKTIASIALLINGLPVWPVSGEDTEEFEWFADELLSHLTECWKPLILRQTYPIPVQPQRPSFLFVEAQKRWAELPDGAVEIEEQEVAAFEDAHNLANAFGGVSGLLPLWFVRDREEMTVDTQEHFFRVPLSDAIACLEFVGNKIAKQLEDDQDKWGGLLKAWANRNEGADTSLLAFMIGRDQKTAAALVEQNLLKAPVSFYEAANDRDELRIAARMAGPMPLAQIKSILQKVRDCRPTRAPRLEQTANAAIEFIGTSRLADDRYYVQGNELAKWLRRHLDLSDGKKIDPVRILEKSFSVDVRFLDLGIPALDAIAVWGPKHGPATLLNSKSNRVKPLGDIWKQGAIRVTAAHELCHFLLDSKHTLSAVEVLGGRMPLGIEQRARAFAAEFLLPSSEAAAIWHSLGASSDLEGVESAIEAICKKHEVTESVASWQLQHGAESIYQEALAQILDQLVPHR